jgi:hypothetical protein
MKFGGKMLCARRLSFLAASFALGCIVASPLYGQQRLLQITSPANQALINEQTTVPITVLANPSVQKVFVNAQSPLPPVTSTADPTQFTLYLSKYVTPGIYTISALGQGPSGELESAAVQIDVERLDSPMQLTVTPTFMSFQSIGDQLPINVWGNYSDGSKLWLTNASRTTYLSNSTQVATAAANGLGSSVVTPVGPGQATITVQAGRARTTVSVEVPQPPLDGGAS